VQSIDSQDSRRTEALLAGERRLLELIATGSPLTQVLERLCLLVEEAADGCRCSVLLLDSQSGALQHGAAPSLPAEVVQAIDGRSIASCWGPCAIAVRDQEQLIVPDIAHDSRWHEGEWARLATTAGLRSCWTTPIVATDGRTLGAFALYQTTPGNPTPLHHELIGRCTHLASIAIERDAHEAMLRRSQAFLGEAQRLSGTGSFSWHVPSDTIDWSEQTYRIYGLDPQQPVTFGIVGSRIHPDEVEWFAALLSDARRHGGDLEFEHRLLMPDGSIRQLHVVAHATRNAAGDLEYIGAVQDVTDRRRSEDALNAVRTELARIARMTALGALSASIAHEVTQPLTGIITNANTSLRMLSGASPDIEGARGAAMLTLRDAHRASDVIARLRAMFARTTTTLAATDLNDAVRELLLLLSGELQRAGVSVRTELGDGVPHVMGDRTQLQQVLLNLVMNAVDAMQAVAGRPRQLTIRSARSGDGVQISIEDTGTGIDPGRLHRLFDPFYTTKSDGMGIGLSVSRSIVESHHGTLWVALNSGSGATFAFSIPSTGAQAPIVPRQIRGPSSPTISPPRASEEAS
jgi:signal transduction histidine kinase